MDSMRPVRNFMFDAEGTCHDRLVLARSHLQAPPTIHTHEERFRRKGGIFISARQLRFSEPHVPLAQKDRKEKNSKEVTSRVISAYKGLPQPSLPFHIFLISPFNPKPSPSQCNWKPWNWTLTNDGGNRAMRITREGNYLYSV